MVLENVSNILTFNCQVCQPPIELLNSRHYFIIVHMLLCNTAELLCVLFSLSLFCCSYIS